ncbi:hypothetical protein [Streptomyces sp. WAC06614]|uniref:hypothetical protein n=1 Tax=Streptomyces sp. WAC06614 TaxID=2487416 RepID=UPI000F7AE3CC|nr:hypothetical protein [Streptomyces sp. WAC06614]RSS79365.1 hypothetical protein EF918_17715 [Streptomyces sp. WAC06614]
MCSAEAQATALAALLAAATGTEPRLDATHDRIRIEADLPTELGPAVHADILRTLAQGARYGHQRTHGGEDTVWVEIDRR